MAGPSRELAGRLYRERLAAAKARIAERLGARRRRPTHSGSLRRRFVIAHSPRVGSHLLCEHLAAFGAEVEEFFEAPRIAAAAARQGLADLGAYGRWVVAAHGANGIFGVSGGVKTLAPLTLLGELPAFAGDWRFVFLTRADFVAQAVSELIARRTGVFRHGATPRRAIARSDYDAVRLKRLIDAAMTVNAAWEGAFEALGVTPLRLAYEDLAADPAGVVARVATYLGLAPIGVASGPAAGLRRQAGPLNAAWIARFRADHPAFCRSRAAGEFGPQASRVTPARLAAPP